MTTHRISGKTSIMSVTALTACLMVGAMGGSSLAQEHEAAERVQQREQIRHTAQDEQGNIQRDRIRERVENEDGLKKQEREQLRRHLDECDRLGLNDDVVSALFDESEPLREQIRTQERVLSMAREGLPIEPVTQKLQEGRRKGVNKQTRERACDKMEAHVRTANRFMEQARKDGVTPGDPDAEQQRTREMAKYMWRGLNESEMEQLRERSQRRLRDGSCTTDDLTAAAETSVKLREMGVERQRAMRIAGEALQYGYAAREMHQLAWMVMTARMHGGHQDEVLDTLERGIRNQYRLSEMTQQMWQHGWMGPADEHGGRGGHGSMNDATGGGPGGREKKHGDQDGDGGRRGGGEGGGQGGQ